jgi:hypothetical protein
VKLCREISVHIAVLCAFASAQVQSNDAGKDQRTWVVHGVDATAHVEADGIPAESTPKESLAERLVSSSASKRPQATTVWGTHANIFTKSTDDKSGVPRVGMSSFRPQTESEQPGVWRPKSLASTDGAKNDDSHKTRVLLSNDSRNHHLSADPKSSFITRTTVLPVFKSDQTTEFSDPFGPATLGLGMSSNLFPKRDPFNYKARATGKRYQHHPRKPMVSSVSRSSIDSLSTTRYQRPSK